MILTAHLTKGNRSEPTENVVCQLPVKSRQCLLAVRVWKFVLKGRRNDSSEQIYNWRLEDSNDDSEWTVLRPVNTFTIDSVTHQFIVDNNTTSYEFYRIFVVEGHGTNHRL